MMVSGAVFADRIVTQELTGYITLGDHPADPDGGLRRVAQILVALKECTQELIEFYEGLELEEIFVDQSPVPRKQSSKLSASQTQQPNLAVVAKNPLRSVFPYLTKYLINGVECEFKYEDRLTPPDSSRAVFKANMVSPGKEGIKVVVKFTRRYSKDAHKLLADESLAPKLLHHELIEGPGIHFVVMECLEGNPIREGDDELKRRGRATHVGQLRRALQKLHAEGFVFGDLREPNILITENDLKLVDFDWCGKQGEAFYPASISKDIRWPEGVQGEDKIEVAHDKFWFKTLTGVDL